MIYDLVIYKFSYLPSHVIVQNALNKNSAVDKRDENIRARIEYELNIFTHYLNAYQTIREEAEFDFKKYPFGM